MLVRCSTVEKFSSAGGLPKKRKDYPAFFAVLICKLCKLTGYEKICTCALNLPLMNESLIMYTVL